MIRRLLIVLALALALNGAPERVRAADPSPEATVTAFDGALQQAMQGGHQLGYQGRFDVLQPAMDQAFDFATMTRIAAGFDWAKLPSAQQQQLVDAFGRYSIATYANQFDGYAGQKFTVTGTSKLPQGIVVATTMASPGGDLIRFNYLLHEVAGGWKIIDIYLDGTISQLAVRRSEFASVLKSSGADGLIALLQRRTTALASAK